MDSDSKKIFESYDDSKNRSKHTPVKKLSQSREVKHGIEYTPKERELFHHEKEKKRLRDAGYNVKQEDKDLVRMKDDEHNPPDDEYTDDTKEFTSDQQSMIDSDEYWRDLYGNFEGMDEDGLRRELSLVDCPKKAAAIKNLLDMDDWEREFWWGNDEVYQEQLTGPSEEYVYPSVETLSDFIEYYLADTDRAHFKPEALKTIDQVDYDANDYDRGEWPGETLVVIVGLGGDRYGDDYVIIRGERDVGYEVTSTSFKPIDGDKMNQLLNAKITWDYDPGATKRGAEPKLKTYNVKAEYSQKLAELEAEHYGISTFALKQNYYNYGGPTEHQGSWHPSDFR